MTLTPEQQKILSGITLETTPKIKPTLEVKSTSTPFTDEQLKMLDSVEVEEEPTVRLHPSQKSAEPEYITVYDRGNTSRKVNNKLLLNFIIGIFLKFVKLDKFSKKRFNNLIRLKSFDLLS